MLYYISILVLNSLTINLNVYIYITNNVMVISINESHKTIFDKVTILACSELSSDVPGLATHFLKHLSDIF